MVTDVGLFLELLQGGHFKSSSLSGVLKIYVLSLLKTLVEDWFHLSSLQLRPNLEEKEDPTPSLLLFRLESPPGQAGESKVDRQCTDHDKEATQVIGRKFLDQEGVKEDVEAGHDDVEEEETQGWGDNVLFALLLNHVKWNRSMGDNLSAHDLNCVIIGGSIFFLILAIIL